MKVGQPYWWDDQPDVTQPSELPSKCELLIVGAGYTGLTAAITAASAGMEVCVVDAEYPGYGASSRNGGMCGAHPRMSLAAMSKKFGGDVARGVFDEAGQAFEFFQSLLKQHDIDCDYQSTGRIQLAWTKADFEAQKAMATEMNDETGYAVEVLSRSDLAKHIKTPHYFGALYFRNHGAVQPRKLVDGLAGAAAALGVKIVPNAMVKSLTRSGTGFKAVTPIGNIEAKRALITTNGYTKGKGALRWLSRRVFPLPSYLIATEQLGRQKIKELAPAGNMMVETHPRHSYWRASPDGTRIIFGGRAAIRQLPLAKAADRLSKNMQTIWPDLGDVKVSHVWSGNTGYTFQAMPQTGQIDGINFAAGYCGGGVVLAPYLGMKAAFQVMGDKRGNTNFSNTEYTSRPYYLGGAKPLFLEIADRWFTYVADPRENRKAAKHR